MVRARGSFRGRFVFLVDELPHQLDSDIVGQLSVDVASCVSREQMRHTHPLSSGNTHRPLLSQFL